MQEKINKLVEELLAKELVTQDQVEKAQKEAEATGATIDRVLISMGAVKNYQLSAVKADLLGVPFVNLKEYLVEQSAIDMIPEEIARKYNIVPLFKIRDTLTIAMPDTLDIYTIDELQRRTKSKTIDAVLSTPEDILYALDRYYGVSGDVEEAVKDVDIAEFETKAAPEEVETRILEQMAEEAPVVKVVNLLVIRAIRERASDVHLEPAEDHFGVRFRVDGVLRNINPLPKHLQGAVVSRIKILAKLDIAEKRKPQDGRIQVRLESRDIDLRVSTFPTVYGENVVIRILDKTSFLLGLPQLGFSKDELKRVDKVIRRPHGIILVTGPTGSGKTTSLYAILNAINATEKNIITIEDPIEYQLPLIRQSQVNPKAGLTFATGLRSILRQDPDIIMVGEIRDVETAEIAVHAALTGHLVFSTLHTNDAPGALTRLEDMGVEPFLISSSVIGIAAQRLVRVLCDKCKEKYHPEKELLKDLHITDDHKKTFYKPKGCSYCDEVGYKGRIGIFELLLVSEDIKKLILSKASSDEIKALARRQSMVTLWEAGLEKVREGITSLEEVVKVTKEEEVLG